MRPPSEALSWHRQLLDRRYSLTCLPRAHAPKPASRFVAYAVPYPQWTIGDRFDGRRVLGGGFTPLTASATIVPALLSTGRQHVPTFVGD